MMKENDWHTDNAFRYWVNQHSCLTPFVRYTDLALMACSHSERNINRTRGSAMLQRWLGTVLLYCEQQFTRVKGFAEMAQVMATIEAEHAEK